MAIVHPLYRWIGKDFRHSSMITGRWRRDAVLRGFGRPAAGTEATQHAREGSLEVATQGALRSVQARYADAAASSLKAG